MAFVNREGMCFLFKRGRTPRLVDFVEDADPTVKRRRLLRWSEDAHLRGEMFLSVDGRGSLVAMATRRLEEARARLSQSVLTADERRLLATLRKSMSTPEMREASGLPGKRFERALLGLRSKMRIALVEVRAESRTKHLNCYAKMETWDRCKGSRTRTGKGSGLDRIRTGTGSSSSPRGSGRTRFPSPCIDVEDWPRHCKTG